MATKKQELGKKGEALVVKMCRCPKCKRESTFRRLPPNFKCADLICDFCGFLAQVKTMTSKNADIIPRICLGAAWSVQKDRMDSGIYFPLYLVQIDGRKKSIHYLSADLQSKKIFIKRKPLSKKARRSGWQGFFYDFSKLSRNSFCRVL